MDVSAKPCTPSSQTPYSRARLTSLGSCGKRVIVELNNALAENVLDGVFAAIVLADASSKLENTSKTLKLET